MFALLSANTLLYLWAVKAKGLGHGYFGYVVQRKI